MPALQSLAPSLADCPSVYFNMSQPTCYKLTGSLSLSLSPPPLPLCLSLPHTHKTLPASCTALTLPPCSPLINQVITYLSAGGIFCESANAHMHTRKCNVVSTTFCQT
jgi:hypothetical protein